MIEIERAQAERLAPAGMEVSCRTHLLEHYIRLTLQGEENDLYRMRIATSDDQDNRLEGRGTIFLAIWLHFMSVWKAR